MFLEKINNPRSSIARGKSAVHFLLPPKSLIFNRLFMLL